MGCQLNYSVRVTEHRGGLEEECYVCKGSRALMALRGTGNAPWRGKVATFSSLSPSDFDASL